MADASAKPAPTCNSGLITIIITIIISWESINLRHYRADGKNFYCLTRAMIRFARSLIKLDNWTGRDGDRGDDNANDDDERKPNCGHKKAQTSQPSVLKASFVGILLLKRRQALLLSSSCRRLLSFVFPALCLSHLGSVVSLNKSNYHQMIIKLRRRRRRLCCGAGLTRRRQR